MVWFGIDSIDSTAISRNTVITNVIKSARAIYGGYMAVQGKINTDHVLRNYHRFKTTQPISKILVSMLK